MNANCCSQSGNSPRSESNTPGRAILPPISFRWKEDDNRVSKIILSVAVWIFLSCVCICIVGFGGISIIKGMIVVDDPEAARRIAHSMVDYELPAGYGDEMALNFFVCQLVMFRAHQEDIRQPVLVFLQASEVSDGDGMFAQFKDSMQSDYEMELVEEKEILIRGQTTSLYVYEGTDDQGMQRKQVFSDTFSGKEGLVMLFVDGPSQGWDDEEINQFVNSIR